MHSPNRSARLLALALSLCMGAAMDGLHVMTVTGDGARTMTDQIDSAERHAGALQAFFEALPAVSVAVRARDEPDFK